MKFKLVDSTGILRMKSLSIPVVVHNAKRDQIDVVILIRNMQKVFAQSFIKDNFNKGENTIKCVAYQHRFQPHAMSACSFTILTLK